MTHEVQCVWTQAAQKHQALIHLDGRGLCWKFTVRCNTLPKEGLRERRITCVQPFVTAACYYKISPRYPINGIKLIE